MSALSPRLSDVRLSPDIITDHRVRALSPVAFRALLLLVNQVASGLVWTYSPPGDGNLDYDDRTFARVVGVSPRMWRAIRPDLEQFFSVGAGGWSLQEAWIEVGNAGRLAIPADIRETVERREDRCCTYCGAVGCRLEVDHIFPVARGGSNDPSNLTLACETCNRSKGAKTLREWVR